MTPNLVVVGFSILLCRITVSNDILRVDEGNNAACDSTSCNDQDSELKQWLEDIRLDAYWDDFKSQRIYLADLIDLDTTSVDFNDFCNDIKLKSMEKKRFRDAIKKLQTFEPPGHVAVISAQEEEMMNKIHDIYLNILKMNKKIEEKRKELHLKTNQCEDKINNYFDEIQNKTELRRQQLLKQLHEFKQNETFKWNATQLDLNSFKSSIKTTETECKNMIAQLNAHRNERKRYILNLCQSVLQNDMWTTTIPLITNQVGRKEYIHFISNEQDYKYIEEIGYVQTTNLPLQPLVTVKHTGRIFVHVQIEIQTLQIETPYTLVDNISIEIQEADSQSVWIETKFISINEQHQNNKYDTIVSGLINNTNYLIRSRARNKIGWGAYSTAIDTRKNNFTSSTQWSSILNCDQELSFYELLESKLGLKKKYNLIYRATRDGFDYKNFRKRMEGKHNVVGIISNNKNYIFGFYTHNKWIFNSKWQAADNADFVFRIHPSKQIYGLSRSHQNKGLYCYSSSAHLFLIGGTHDIYIEQHANKGGNGYCASGTFSAPNYQLSGASTYKVKDIEIYQVS